jgi:hypothetical protein
MTRRDARCWQPVQPIDAHADPYFYDYTPSCAAIPISLGESFAKYRLDKQRGSLLKRKSRGPVVTQKAAGKRPDFS